MNRDQLQAFFTQPYDQAAWLQTIHEIFPRTELFAHPQTVPIGDSRAKSVLQLGNTRLADDRGLAILEVAVVETTDLSRNRVGLRNLVTKFIDQDRHHGVLAIFRTPQPNYRFTFVAREVVLDESGQITKRETAPRRFTYLLGPGEACRTAAERFTELARKGDKATLRDLTGAFSIEKLNKEFFADYCKVFGRVHKDIAERQPRWSKQIVEQQTQTLLNRLLFLCFIQRKGWLNQQRDYLVRNFREQYAGKPDDTTYLRKFLHPVFEKLSTPAAIANLDDHLLPFLNGGLFSDEIGAEHVDEAVRRHRDLKVANATFQHVFDDLLEIYNFTIREDSPSDQEVAIDPEMLGKIFESLVLQIEKSDGGTESLRHDTGSHYTPRPIVHYLCTEGLRGWLEQFPPSSPSVRRGSPDRADAATEGLQSRDGRPAVEASAGSGDPRTTEQTTERAKTWASRLSKLLAIDASDGIDDAERAILDDCLTAEEAKALLDRLETLRACDPAVGSGAFPVGLLHELVNLMRLCETRSRGKDPVTRDSNWLYDTKSAIIRRVIYGVDIQERAVEICKLRLWLSLMVDFDIGVDVDNCSRSAFRAALKNITPLPNLDYKIRRADSLIDQVCGHPVILPRSLQDAGSFNDALNKLSSAKLAFYSAHSQRDKRKHHFDILAATADLALNVFKQSKLDLKGSLIPHDDDLARLAELEQATTDMLAIQGQIKAARKLPAAQQDDELQRITGHFDDPEKPTFVWQLDFAEVFHRKDAAGFDLMLANPPYVRMELFKDIKPELRARYGNVHVERADLYVYFYARTIELLCVGGALSYISSNKWLRAKYGANLRQFISDSCEIRAIIDFGELPVFENAATFPMIFVSRKGKLGGPKSVFVQVSSLQPPYPDIGAIVRKAGVSLPAKAVNGPNWTLSTSKGLALVPKMLGRGISLEKYVKGQLHYGIKTGFNKAFVIDAETRSRLLAECPKSAEIIKPLILGDDIRKWRVNYQDAWLLYLPHGVDVAEMDAVLDVLRPYKARLESRATEQAWYELQQPQAKYAACFQQPKIVFPDICKESRFAYDTRGAYLGNTAYAIPTNDFYLLGVLNSTAVWEYAKATFVCLGDPEQGGRLRFIYQFMTKVPIPNASAAERAAVVGLVERVLAAKRTDSQADVAALEQEIDAHVYRLYGLTQDEIKLVEESTKK